MADIIILPVVRVERCDDLPDIQFKLRVTVDGETAAAIKKRADVQGLSVATYLASIVETLIAAEFP